MATPTTNRICMRKNTDIVETSTWMTFKTDNTSTGSSNNNQVTLPLESSGTYNMVVDWGDGSKSTITAYNQAEVTHTYGAIGTYDIKITGTCRGWRFNNASDKLKLMIIKRWGNGFRLGNNNGYFYGCSNLRITATDILDVTSLTNISAMFRNCAGLVSVNLNNIATNNVTNMGTVFNGCSNLETLQIDQWNTAKVTTMSGMFQACSKLENVSVSNFNTGLVTNMFAMFFGCTILNVDVSNFNIASVTSASDMFSGSGFGNTNYDLLLVAWEAQTEKINVAFHAGTAKYSAGAPKTARNALVASGWSITDGGELL